MTMRTRTTVVRQTWEDDKYHIARALSNGKPGSAALCGVERIAQQPGERPMWADCRNTIPASRACQSCWILS